MLLPGSTKTAVYVLAKAEPAAIANAPKMTMLFFKNVLQSRSKYTTIVGRLALNRKIQYLNGDASTDFQIDRRPGGDTQNRSGACLASRDLDVTGAALNYAQLAGRDVAVTPSDVRDRA